ncbi:MAG: caspase family protein [Muribaculaceae bacterium]|nr:caspase family protein [Muribaculaceae bacterium]
MMKRILTIVFILCMASPMFSQRIQRCSSGLYGLAIRKTNGNVKWLAKPQYTVIKDCKNGSFAVLSQNGFWGVVTSAGKEVVPCNHRDFDSALEAYKFYINPESKNYASNLFENTGIVNNASFTLERDYTSYIKAYVEDNVKNWQKKGEFEKTSDYVKRVTEETRKAKAIELTKKVCDECLSKVQDKELRMTLGEYDADNETFLVETTIGKFVIPVSIREAPDFKKNWSKIISKNTYDIANGRIILRNAEFYLNNKMLTSYNDKNQILYAKANVNYNFDPIEVEIPNSQTNNKPLISQNDINLGKSDVDQNIPLNKLNNEKTFALIIANEKYREESQVAFAKNDGQAILKYFNLTLGVPEKNIHIIEDATKNDMVRELDWLKNVGKVYDDLNLLVYYAGHGVPDERDGSAYLIPIDGVGTNTKTLYSLNEFYKDLEDVSAKSTVVFMDACFSGALRGNGMLASARGIALKAKEATPTANMIVISAASGDQTAWPYAEKSHGLFTYFLLKKLQSTKGDVTLENLVNYVKDEVGKHSIVVNSKQQTPTIAISPSIGDSWRSLKIR